MSEEVYTEGQCKRPLRLKHWKSGFSVKCVEGVRTFMGTPFDPEAYAYGFATFCSDCPDRE